LRCGVAGARGAVVAFDGDDLAILYADMNIAFAFTARALENMLFRHFFTIQETIRRLFRLSTNRQIFSSSR
jgi:hypothetical protein